MSNSDWWSSARCVALQAERAGRASVAGNAGMNAAPPCSPTEAGEGVGLRPAARPTDDRTGGAHQGTSATREPALRAEAGPSGPVYLVRYGRRRTLAVCDTRARAAEWVERFPGAQIVVEP